MIAGPAWLRQGLLLLATLAVLVGAIELALIAGGRRRAVPGYGWETEVAHLLMNAIMAAMLTSLWSAAIARAGAVALAGATVLLVTVPLRRSTRPAADRTLVAIATAIHVGATMLMLWLTLRMAPSSVRGMAMHHAAGTGWVERLCAGFFLFDLASVLIVAALAGRMPDRLRGDAPRVSILPHVAMDVGMIAMLVAA